MICTRYVNNTFLNVQIKTKNGEIYNIEPYQEKATSKDNPITHYKRLIFGNEKFKKIQLNKIKQY